MQKNYRCPRCRATMEFDPEPGKMHCNSCGAELAVNEVEASSFCAYCGQATVVLDRVEEYLEPDYVIPFSVTKEQAESTIRERIKSGYYVPSVIKNFEVEKLRGIYIPFWLYDIYYGDEKYFKYSARVTNKTYVTRYIHHVAEMHFKRLTQDASSRKYCWRPFRIGNRYGHSILYNDVPHKKVE